MKALANCTQIFRYNGFNLLSCLGDDQVVVLDFPEL